MATKTKTLQADPPYAMALPVHADWISEDGLWIIDAKGDYIAEAVSEDSEGKLLKDFEERRKAFLLLARAANQQQPQLAALQAAAEIISTARRYFPKAIRNADRFALELAAAEVGKAIAAAEAA